MMKIKYSFCIALFVIANYVNAQNYNPHSLSFDGYIRSGIGRTLPKGEMVTFSLPGSIYKPRLGNENGHLAELQFTYKYQPENSKKSYEISYMGAKYMPYADFNMNEAPEIAQLFVRMNNIWGTADIWAGRRYYDRYDIHMLDYFWLNTGQNAEMSVGIEDISMYKGSTMKIALFQFEYDPTQGKNKDSKAFNSYTLEGKWLDYPLNDSWKINFLAQAGYRDSSPDKRYEKVASFGLGSWATYKKGLIDYTTILHFRQGVLMAKNPYTGKSILDYNGAGMRIYDSKKAYTIDFLNNFVYDDKQKHALQAYVNYQLKDYGIGQVNDNNIETTTEKIRHQISIGTRYLHYISKHFNLAVELSNDYVNDEKYQLSGNVSKITFAPQISWDYGYYSRPVIRPFITYAHWSNSLKGLVGTMPKNDVFAEKTHGITVGLQVEVWW